VGYVCLFGKASLNLQYIFAIVNFYNLMTTYHLITLFPETVQSYVNSSILKRAQEKELISIKYYNPRDFVISKEKNKDVSMNTIGGEKQLTYAERRVDNRPYGGGPGMVLEALPVIRAIEAALSFVIPAPDRSRGQAPAGIPLKKKTNEVVSKKSKPKVKIVFFSPSGEQFSNEITEKFKKYTDIVFVCGRYEGIDARVKKAFPMVDISVGPYVLTGGELPAMIMIDTITRRIPGVLGDHASVEENRISSPDVYTRPEIIEYKGKKYRVPKVLLSGHHAKMDEWRTVVRADGGQKKRQKRGQ
jgi:tRNA (guanine37-N1)-methyltransferase